MNNYTEYHDGFFDGLWIQDEGTLQVYLRTSGKKRNTVALTGVVMLKVLLFAELAPPAAARTRK